MSTQVCVPTGTAPCETALRFHLITTFAELEKLAPAWQELLEHSAAAEPMLAPSWLLTWWQVYGGGRELRVGLFYEGERLLGLAPLCLRRARYRPGLSFRRLECLGADVEENDGVCSDYLNLIVRAGSEARVAQAFAAEVRRGSFGAWDEVLIPAMAGDGPMPALLNEAFQQAGFGAEVTTTNQAPYLPLPGSWEEHLRSLNKKKRQGLVYALRDFEEWAGAYQLEKAHTPSDLLRGWQILKDLHGVRWQEAERSGAFAAPRFAAFHQATMPLLLQEGKLQLWWLIVRDEPVAAMYSIVANGKVYFYQCGRKMDVPNKVRLGIVLLIFALRDAMAAGLREFDFLGGEAPYKQQLTHTCRPLVQFRAVRPSLKELLRRGAARCISWLRSVRNAVRRRR